MGRLTAFRNGERPKHKNKAPIVSDRGLFDARKGALNTFVD